MENVPIPNKYRHLLFEMLKTNIKELNTIKFKKPILDKDLIDGVVYNKTISLVFNTAWLAQGFNEVKNNLITKSNSKDYLGIGNTIVNKNTTIKGVPQGGIISSLLMN